MRKYILKMKPHINRYYKLKSLYTKIINNILIYDLNKKIDNNITIESICKNYLEKDKYSNKDKRKILEAISNSKVCSFKIISVDYYNAYVIIEDIETKERFKIIDISLSASPIEDKIYSNRIITIDDISFLEN